ncbi:MAG: hypothetical protein WCE79_27335 [Xanthobacteraceae bacterium]
MAYASDHFGFFTHHAPAARNARGILRRMVDGMFETRQRKAERDIAAYIAHSGGRLTDSIERELMERYSNATFGEPRT